MELARVWKRYHLVQQVADLESGIAGEGPGPEEDLFGDGDGTGFGL